ncbi:hypothetical protein DFJ73DRAFT_760614 [Zopfochytrium polystomum]|nr:hypothetical protein DFJ73DRAFT_760614 [Zopfochytrium polystomum]
MNMLVLLDGDHIYKRTDILLYIGWVTSNRALSICQWKYNLKTEQIESFNTLTFGWLGCNRLQAGAVICLSTGSAPLPPVDPAAECRLQSMVNGKRNGTSSGASAVLQPISVGTGCQSNCGMGYPQSATSPPAHSQYRVGYYATWTRGNACTASSLLQYNLTGYTHIILAFATITSDYKIAFDASAQAALSELAKLSGVKRMVSIGGWGFTDDPATQPIFSRMVANGRSVFIQSLVAMLNAGTADGFDLDWEYPTASDRGGNAQDIPNYLQLFSDMRKAMPNAPISVTAPASLWYLRGFDIKAISSYVDFINYMTYDFHGQWDYANKWTGPFLRSHVNWTETVDALSLIVRAGVPSNKITLGIAHYARSFRMSSTGCTLPGCTFSSQVADAGTCTGTEGIWTQPEIDEYVRLYGEHFNRCFDTQSRSMIGTCGNQWGAYLTEDEKQYRRQQAAAMNLAGTMEWAIDMLPSIQTIQPVIVTNARQGISYDSQNITKAYCDQFADYNLLNIDSVPEQCRRQTLCRGVMRNVTDAVSKFRQLDTDGDYPGYFQAQVEATKDYMSDPTWVQYGDQVINLNKASVRQGQSNTTYDEGKDAAEKRRRNGIFAIVGAVLGALLFATGIVTVGEVIITGADVTTTIIAAVKNRPEAFNIVGAVLAVMLSAFPAGSDLRLLWNFRTVAEWKALSGIQLREGIMSEYETQYLTLQRITRGSLILMARRAGSSSPSAVAEIMAVSLQQEEPRMQVAATYSKEHNLDDIVQDSLKRMANVIESHLTVSSSYVVSRYLKVISAESTAADGTFDVQWLEASDQRPAIPRLTVPHGLSVYSLPGLRLATKLTEAMVQESLNRAKHQADDAQSEDLMSLLTGTGQVTLYYSNSASDSLIKRTAHSDNVSSVVRKHGWPLFITSREHTQSLFSSPKSRLMSLLMMTSYICQKYSIPAARDEIVDFVSILDASLETVDLSSTHRSLLCARCWIMASIFCVGDTLMLHMFKLTIVTQRGMYSVFGSVSRHCGQQYAEYKQEYVCQVYAPAPVGGNLHLVRIPSTVDRKLRIIMLLLGVCMKGSKDDFFTLTIAPSSFTFSTYSSPALFLSRTNFNLSYTPTDSDYTAPSWIWPFATSDLSARFALLHLNVGYIEAKSINNAYLSPDQSITCPQETSGISQRALACQVKYQIHSLAYCA